MTLRSKKSQAIVEQLMTYSWGIIIVTIALIALVLFGPFNVDAFFWDKCSFDYPLACADHSVVDRDGSVDVRLLLANLNTEPVTITQIVVKSHSLTNPCNINAADALPMRIERGEKKAFIVNSTEGNGSQNCESSFYFSKNRNKYEISVIYHYGEYQELTRSLKGELIALVNRH